MLRRPLLPGTASLAPAKGEGRSQRCSLRTRSHDIRWPQVTKVHSILHQRSHKDLCLCWHKTEDMLTYMYVLQCLRIQTHYKILVCHTTIPKSVVSVRYVMVLLHIIKCIENAVNQIAIKPILSVWRTCSTWQLVADHNGDDTWLLQLRAYSIRLIAVQGAPTGYWTLTQRERERERVWWAPHCRIIFKESCLDFHQDLLWKCSQYFCPCWGTLFQNMCSKHCLLSQNFFNFIFIFD